jgi:hypothetical protein
VNSSESVNDVGLADHLIEPVLNSGVGRPPILWLSVTLINK